VTKLVFISHGSESMTFIKPLLWLKMLFIGADVALLASSPFETEGDFRKFAPPPD
jgi:hypothetical protein